MWEVNMDTLIQGGKYQVLEVIDDRDGYKACLCIDVEINNHYKPMIFNIYEKEEDIRRFLPVFFYINKDQCTDFVRVMSGKHNIISVFEYHQGVKLPDFFKQIEKFDFELRCKYTHLLLKECLILDALADCIAYECLNPDNIVIYEESQKVMINYIIRPNHIDGKNFKGKQVATLLECIFVKNRYVPDKLWDFLADLRRNENINIVGIFSKWKEIEGVLIDEHKKLKKETFAAYLIRRFKQIFRKRR